jgi:hypothetical protein
MSEAQRIPAPVPGLKWHENGRYLTKDECLAHIAKLREKSGRSGTLSPDEYALGLEDCHALLSSEMQADFDAITGRLHGAADDRKSSVLKAGVWLSLAAIGIASPYILKTGLAPSWLEWLLKGSGGSAQSWQLLGFLSLAVGSIELLRWAADRFHMPLLGRTSDWIARGLLGLMLLAGIAFVALFGSLFLGLLIPWLTNVLPPGIAVYLRDIDREPGAFVLSGAIAAAIVASGALIYLRIRRSDPDSTPVEAIGHAAFSSFEPFFLFTMIALKAFVWFGLLLIALTHWFPKLAGDWSVWIDTNSRPILATAVGLSLLAPFFVYGYRLRYSRKAQESRPFAESCWIVFYALSGFGLLMIAVMLAVAGLRTLG